MALLTAAAHVAFAQGRHEASAAWFDLPLAGGARTLAHLGIDPTDRAQTFPLLARILYGAESRAVTTLDRLTAFLRTPGSGSDLDGGTTMDISMPLSRRTWQTLLRIDDGDDLSTGLLTDRAATLLAAGFATTDESIRQVALQSPDFVRRLYDDCPAAFAIAARSLRIAGGRVVVPGGEEADRAWEMLAGASVREPTAFILALLTKDAGRLAWFFDTMTAARAVPRHGIVPLYESFRSFEPRWRPEDHPFRRAAGDPALLLDVLELDGDGLVAGAPWHWFWEALFRRGAIDRQAAAILNPGPDLPPTVSWLATTIAASNARERRHRFEMFRLAQRVFTVVRIDQAADVIVALSAYPTHKSVLLTLERMGITTPSTWATLVEAARYVDTAGDRRESLASLQAAIALVARAYHVGTLDSAGAERLLLAISERIRSEHGVARGVRDWLLNTWCCHAGIVDVLSGPAPHHSAQRIVEWEGLTYHVDFAAAERERLTRMLRVLRMTDFDATLRKNDDESIARALVTLTYATALGDPAGAITLSPDLPMRHDFGLRSTALVGETLPWSLPAEQHGTGRTWHVEGSLIGLDLALARHAMKQVAGNAMPAEPTLSLNDFDTFARTAVAMKPQHLRDDDRDEIVAAIARGRTRTAPGTSISLRDALWLGKPSMPAERLHDWGMFAQAIDGRLALAMPRAVAWEQFAGRSDTGQVSTQVPDLTLRLAEETARLKLPAALIPAMLAAAVPDYWYGVQARFSDDYPQMMRTAVGLAPERAEDYVATLTGGGPLRLRDRK